MAMTDYPTHCFPGIIIRTGNRTLALQAVTLDAAGEKATCVFQVPKTGNISHVHFKCGTVTSSGDADVRLETVDATTGQPSGTLVGTNTNATQTISSSNTWFRVALTASASVTVDTLIALVISNSTGNYQVSLTDAVACVNNFPYSNNFVGGAWATQPYTMVMLVEYDDTTYPLLPGILPIKTITNVNLSTGSTPDEAGLKFTAPVSLRAKGVWAYFDCDNTCEIHLYDSGGSSIASVVGGIDPQVRTGNSAGSHFYYFGASVTLTAGATYRVVFKPTSGSNITIPVFDIDNAAYMSAFPGGTDMVYTSRTDAGAWSETTTRRPNIGLLVDGIESGGGGPLIGGRLAA